MNIRTMTVEQFFAEAVQKFGPDKVNWKFICPSCGHIASVAEYKAAGGESGAGFSCIGRWIGAKIQAFEKGEGPCNYAGGGLFCISPVELIGHGRFFEFAPEEKMLKCYHDETEWIVAEPPEDASAIQAANIGEEASSPEQFEEVSLDNLLTIHSDADEEFGNGTISKTIAEWIACNGRGLLCSTEW